MGSFLGPDGSSVVPFAGCCANRPVTRAKIKSPLIKTFIGLSLSSIAGFLGNMNQIRDSNATLVSVVHWRFIRMALRDHLFARCVGEVFKKQLLLLRQGCGRGKNCRPLIQRQSCSFLKRGCRWFAPTDISDLPTRCREAWSNFWLHNRLAVFNDDVARRLDPMPSIHQPRSD